MRESLSILLQVQAIDLEIHELMQQRTALPRALALRRLAIDQKRTTLAARQDELNKARVAANATERDLKEQEAKTQKLSVQLNTLKTNKEFATMQSEIATVKADCGLKENEILAHLGKVEALAADVKLLQEDLQQAEAEAAELTAQVETSLKALDASLAEKKNQRAVTTPGLKKEMLEAYNRIQAHKQDGVALARLDGEVCGACYMEPNTQDLNLVRGKRQIVKCRSCGRILYCE